MNEIIKIENSAKNYIIDILKKNKKNILEIELNKKGCGGYSYEYIFSDVKKENKEYQELEENYYIAVDFKNLIFLLNSEIYLFESHLEKKIEIKNKNEKCRCGCGKSFVK